MPCFCQCSSQTEGTWNSETPKFNNSLPGRDMQLCVLPKKDNSFPQIDSEGVYPIHFSGHEKHLCSSVCSAPAQEHWSPAMPCATWDSEVTSSSVACFRVPDPQGSRPKIFKTIQAKGIIFGSDIATPQERLAEHFSCQDHGQFPRQMQTQNYHPGCSVLLGTVPFSLGLAQIHFTGSFLWIHGRDVTRPGPLHTVREHACSEIARRVQIPSRQNYSMSPLEYRNSWEVAQHIRNRVSPLPVGLSA